MICPLSMITPTSTRCEETACAWWNQPTKECGALTFFKALGGIDGEMAKLQEAVDRLREPGNEAAPNHGKLSENMGD